MLEVERDARLVADYPSVVSWPDLECFSRAHRDLFALRSSNCHPTRQNVSDVSHRGLARLFAHVRRPPPPGEISSTSYRR